MEEKLKIMGWNKNGTPWGPNMKPAGAKPIYRGFLNAHSLGQRNSMNFQNIHSWTCIILNLRTIRVKQDSFDECWAPLIFISFSVSQSEETKMNTATSTSMTCIFFHGTNSHSLRELLTLGAVPTAGCQQSFPPCQHLTPQRATKELWWPWWKDPSFPPWKDFRFSSASSKSKRQTSDTRATGKVSGQQTLVPPGWQSLLTSCSDKTWPKETLNV